MIFLLQASKNFFSHLETAYSSIQNTSDYNWKCKNPKNIFKLKDAMAIIMRKNFDVMKIVRQQMFHMECDLF